MSDPGSLIPLGDEQAKLLREAIKALQDVGGFLRQMFGTVPEDIVGYLGGDWLKVRRAQNLARIVQKARERLEARNVDPARPSISIALPLLIAAADEDRDELQEIWARLLAAAADPNRTRAFRNAFIETAKLMDPLDAAVLQGGQTRGGRINGEVRNTLASELRVTTDQIDVSARNLEKLELALPTHRPDVVVSPFGREFLRAISD
jgi:hypothetical protein